MSLHLIQEVELMILRVVILRPVVVLAKHHCDVRVVLTDHLIGFRNKRIEWTLRELNSMIVLFKLMVEECDVCMVIMFSYVIVSRALYCIM